MRVRSDLAVVCVLTCPELALVIRVLYRLRTLSEQTPFDAATYGYASPLLSQVLVKGGIAIGEEDDPLEQIALSLDIIKFHCGECELSESRGILYMQH